MNDQLVFLREVLEEHIEKNGTITLTNRELLNIVNEAKERFEQAEYEELITN